LSDFSLIVPYLRLQTELLCHFQLEVLCELDDNIPHNLQYKTDYFGKYLITWIWFPSNMDIEKSALSLYKTKTLNSVTRHLIVIRKVQLT